MAPGAVSNVPARNNPALLAADAARTRVGAPARGYSQVCGPCATRHDSRDGLLEFPVGRGRRIPAELVSYMKTKSGSHKVLFGTNYPMIAHPAALDGLDELDLDETTRQLYLHGNAARVFHLD